MSRKSISSTPSALPLAVQILTRHLLSLSPTTLSVLASDLGCPPTRRSSERVSGILQVLDVTQERLDGQEVGTGDWRDVVWLLEVTGVEEGVGEAGVLVQKVLDGGLGSYWLRSSRGTPATSSSSITNEPAADSINLRARSTTRLRPSRGVSSQSGSTAKPGLDASYVPAAFRPGRAGGRAVDGKARYAALGKMQAAEEEVLDEGSTLGRGEDEGDSSKEPRNVDKESDERAVLKKAVVVSREPRTRTFSIPSPTTPASVALSVHISHPTVLNTTIVLLLTVLLLLPAFFLVIGVLDTLHVAQAQFEVVILCARLGAGLGLIGIGYLVLLPWINVVVPEGPEGNWARRLGLSKPKLWAGVVVAVGAAVLTNLVLRGATVAWNAIEEQEQEGQV
ncbi:hypothetical protein M427DRAFT_26862 [Gonapodya prolifera JEL478]|uniref:Uncharacterized protein n=1 Tax=Gonapodya prolifera (strain JEL478) TaxID=1344416 RepID=A0A139AZW4_GONPJ|nr:hypothetical protein M427DRAFT_26862 [Gonapodya prolifera JEL478]|eukprot:KXS22254.1 hypothetical protein M427DRAFT_26862 [Gonapodya prolifera JEL478]